MGAPDSVLRNNGEDFEFELCLMLGDEIQLFDDDNMLGIGGVPVDFLGAIDVKEEADEGDAGLDEKPSGDCTRGSLFFLLMGLSFSW